LADAHIVLNTSYFFPELNSTACAARYVRYLGLAASAGVCAFVSPTRYTTMPLAVLQTRKRDGKNPSTSSRAKDIVDAFHFRNFEYQIRALFENRDTLVISAFSLIH